MRIHILDDIHLEFGKFKHRPPECDVVVLSGDIGVGNMAFPWIEQVFPNTPSIYVAGNHEHYGRIIGDQYEAMKQRATESSAPIHFLQNEAVVIDGVRFLGATLWTDFDLYGNAPVATVMAQQKMNDYTQVNKTRATQFSAHDSALEHMVSKQFLRDELEKGFDGKTVVVTHHAPSEESVPEKYLNNPLNAAYASRLENFVLAYEPVLWTHGHIHSSSDYMIGDTRVICNPRGYVGHELNPDFDPNLVIEI